MNLALLIPIHSPKYEYIYSLLKNNKHINNTADIFLIFSNIADYEKFNIIDYNVKYIFADIDKIKTLNIISYKKFYGLKYLMKHEQYKYFIVLDSEIKIIIENFNIENILHKLDDIYINKQIYGLKGSQFKILITDNIKSFNNIDQSKLSNEYYYWWSDIPVYRRTDLNNFFNVIKPNLFTYSFDHLIYLNYLILYENFKIINVNPLLDTTVGSLELYYNQSGDISKLEKLNDIGYGFSYINKQLYEFNKDYLNKKGTFIIYHLDRYL